jgi:D-tyrosyl-tRNA(Tyr) deacylase
VNKGEIMKAAYFFCVDPTKDKVAPAAFDVAKSELELSKASFTCDDMEVLASKDSHGNEYLYIPTREVVSHRLERYLPLINEMLSDCEIAGIVNWHEGNNAPDQILCAHSNGDVPSGVFSPIKGGVLTAVLNSLEKARVAEGLAEWRTLPEATHFAGTQYDAPVELLQQLKVPLVDIEIGSSEASWTDKRAQSALIKGISTCLTYIPKDAGVIVYLGGMHFEPSIKDATVSEQGDPSFSVSHMLPNQWVAPAGLYEGEEGKEKLRAAIRSIGEPIEAIVFHDGLRGPVKAVARAVAEELGVPAVNHKKMRQGREGLNKN